MDAAGPGGGVPRSRVRGSSGRSGNRPGRRAPRQAHNSPIALNDPSAHAEVIAIRRAAAEKGNYRLSGTTLYMTLEPCLMCAGAILHARVERLVFGAADPKSGAAVTLYRIFDDRRMNHTVKVTEGILREACTEILSSFFRDKSYYHFLCKEEGMIANKTLARCNPLPCGKGGKKRKKE